MTKGAKIGIIVGVVIVLLLCCCVAAGVGWYFTAGPGSYQNAAADKLIGAANKKYTAVADSGESMSNAASDLGDKLANDMSADSIENFKDEVTKLESAAQEGIDNLDSADKDLAAAAKLRLPDWKLTYIDTLKRRDAAAREGLQSLIQAFSATRKMVGSLTYVIDGVERITTAFSVIEEVTTAMGNNDFAGALAKINEADASLAAAETALKTANETVKSQDITDMITVSGKFREALPLMRSFLTAIQANDLATANNVEAQLTAKLDEASTAADAVGATSDFSTWFEKSIKKYEDEFTAKFAQADKLQKEAAALLAENDG